ncbi:PilW family protein [Bacillus sp. CGMCC 1.16607]|uniref:PilW family protein n=1 Tax=Bacillus sp. CGMCC 1.16607 TaxID=3351842 RepID=UPI003624DB36
MKNEKGLTLIELLATITIFFILGSLIFGVLINSQKNYATLSTKNSLSQEANLAIKIIKNYHYKVEPYTLSYNETKKNVSIIKGAETIPLVSDNYDATFKAGYSQYDPSVLTKSFNVQDFKKPLAIWLQISDKNGKTYEIDTTIFSYYGE